MWPCYPPVIVEILINAGLASLSLMVLATQCASPLHLPWDSTCVSPSANQQGASPTGKNTCTRHSLGVGPLPLMAHRRLPRHQHRLQQQATNLCVLLRMAPCPTCQQEGGGLLTRNAQQSIANSHCHPSRKQLPLPLPKLLEAEKHARKVHTAGMSGMHPLIDFLSLSG